MGKGKLDKNSDKWVTGSVPIYYWYDGTKYRLTGKSEVPAGTKVLDVYGKAEDVPQDILSEIISHNADDVTLVYRQDGYKPKPKITDQVRPGRSQGTKLLRPANAPPRGGKWGGVFDPSKVKPIPHTTIKVFDGSSYWVSGGDCPTGYWPWFWYMHYNYYITGGDLTQPVDSYSTPFYRVVDDVAVLGHYQKEHIEVRAPENRLDPLNEGEYIAELNTIGKYGCSGFNYFYQEGNNYGVLADGRHYYTHITNDGYEPIANVMYEGYFDRVLAEGKPNTHNPQLGKNHLQFLKIGVKVGDCEYADLTPPLKMDGSYEFTQPAGVIVSGGQWIDAHTGQPYVFPQWNDLPSRVVGPQNFNEYGRNITSRYYYAARVQEFSKKHDEVLHLSYHDEWGGFCDFNISDTDNFYMTKIKGVSGVGITGVGESIIIPHNNNPKIEVVLIPSKWKYWVWIFGVFGEGGSETPKWLCTSFEGTAASDNYGHYLGTHTVDGNPVEMLYIDDLNFSSDWPGEMRYMYWPPHSMSGLPMCNYNRWSDIWTPSGITYGPVFSDPHIDDVVLCSRSLWLRLGSDENGLLPKKNSSVLYGYPGFSAWHMRRTAGQLVAIIRVMYDNGVTDHRYVYAKTNSTDNPTLMAYAHVYGQTVHGGIDGMSWGTPTTLKNSYSPPLGGDVIEDNIDVAYRNLYQWYINEYW